ncbi:hypothetical protein MNBD_GAMMA21-853 [hydrothermal vent metagenome]|uniref:Uncharacterized protein n=1 Tax=hydrothermal vent metagenome TaxID=652676 RepID=A0A3B1AFQ2_9ZZZZ
MKIHRTYKVVILLITALVLSPLLSISDAYAMKHASSSEQQQNTITTGISSCHQISEPNECSQCVPSGDSQCQHSMGDECASSCGHNIVTAAFVNQISDLPLYFQDALILSEQFNMSIVLDPDLRPPQ